MTDAPFFSIIEYTVDGEQTQHALADDFADLQVRLVRSHPGYVSSQIVGSLDGLRLYNLVTWESEEAYRRFEEDSDGAGRAEAIQQVLDSYAGKVASRMTGIPRYRLLRAVGPAS